eukprot:2305774-Rhodomonas_salina.4
MSGTDVAYGAPSGSITRMVNGYGDIDREVLVRTQNVAQEQPTSSVDLYQETTDPKENPTSQ